MKRKDDLKNVKQLLTENQKTWLVLLRVVCKRQSLVAEI